MKGILLDKPADLFVVPEGGGPAEHAESGTLAEMVDWVMLYPLEKQPSFTIRAAGSDLDIEHIRTIAAGRRPADKKKIKR